VADPTEVSLGLLVIRLLLGPILVAHGALKLFPIGEHGLHEGRALVRRLGFRAPKVMTFLSGLASFGGGLLLALGALWPVAVLAVTALMMNAIVTVHGPRGFWTRKGGYEYNLVLLVTVVALGLTGPGAFSVDAALGWADTLSGVVPTAAAVSGSVLASAAAVTLGRDRAVVAARKQEAATSGRP
jgi:putative oxidoreductase